MSETLSQNSVPVWFVTGCSTGFGREFVRQLLAGGFRVVASARKAADLAEFAAHPAACVLELDVTVAAQIADAVAAAEQRFGRSGGRAAVAEGEAAAAAFAEGVVGVFAVPARDDETILVIGDRQITVHLLDLLNA